VAGALCSAAWLSSVACIVTGAGCGSCSGQVPRPNTSLVQSLSVQMLSIGLRRVLRPDPLAISRAYNPTQPDTSGNTRISVLWCRKATIAPCISGEGSAGPRSPVRSGRGLCGPASQRFELPPRDPRGGQATVLPSCSGRPSDLSVVPSRPGPRRRGFSAEGIARIGRVRDGLQLTLKPVERVLSRRAGTRRSASSGPSAGAALGLEVQEECRASQASRSARLVLATQIDVSAAP
jgi:hypothetical protein